MLSSSLQTPAGGETSKTSREGTSLMKQGNMIRNEIAKVTE